jgi:hypothetical protein
MAARRVSDKEHNQPMEFPIDPSRVVKGAQYMASLLDIDEIIEGASSADAGVISALETTATLMPTMPPNEQEAVAALAALAEILLRLREEEQGETPQETLKKVWLDASGPPSSRSATP